MKVVLLYSEFPDTFWSYLQSARAPGWGEHPMAPAPFSA